MHQMTRVALEELRVIFDFFRQFKIHGPVIIGIFKDRGDDLVPLRQELRSYANITVFRTGLFTGSSVHVLRCSLMHGPVFNGKIVIIVVIGIKVSEYSCEYCHSDFSPASPEHQIAV